MKWIADKSVPIYQVKHGGWNSGCVWYFLRLICKTNGAAVTSTHTEHFFSSFSSGMEVDLALSGLHSKQTQPCCCHRQVVLAASAVFTSSWAWRGSPLAACPAETCPVHFGYRAEPFINTLINKGSDLSQIADFLVYGTCTIMNCSAPTKSNTIQWSYNKINGLHTTWYCH